MTIEEELIKQLIVGWYETYHLIDEKDRNRVDFLLKEAIELGIDEGIQETKKEVIHKLAKQYLESCLARTQSFHQTFQGGLEFFTTDLPPQTYWARIYALKIHYNV